MGLARLVNPCSKKDVLPRKTLSRTIFRSAFFLKEFTDSFFMQAILT